MPLMSTQELDARFAVFLNPIRDLTKNWEVDIAKYLEEYLEELADLHITFDEGETLMNFAEAAMLIQGSATVYSKKVEFLWQMVLQMLDLLSSKRSITSGNDPKVAGSSGRGNSTDDAPEFSCIDDLGMSKNINMKMDDDDMEEEREKGFRFLAATPLHLVEKEGEKAQYRINLFMKNWDTFGVKDDFRINRSYLTPQGLLCLEFPVELLQKRSTMGSLPEEEEKSTGTPEPLPDIPEEPVVENEDIGDDLPPPDLFEPEDVPPIEEPMEQDKEKNKQEENEELNKNNNNIAELRKDQTVIELSNGKYGLRKRNEEKQAIVTLKLTDPWVPLDPHSLTPSRRPVRAGRLRKPLPCSCHKALEKKTRKGKKEEEETKDEKATKGELSLVGNFITRGITSSVIETSVKKDKALTDLQVDSNKEAVKRLEMTRRSMTRQMMKEKETLESAQERVEEEMQLEQENGEDFGCDGDAAVDMGDDIPAVPMFLPDPHSDEMVVEGGRVERINATQGDEMDSEYEKLVQKLVTDYISSAHEYIASSELTSRVNRWKENVLPVLDEEERRKEFDIHRYGTQVLAHFPDNGRKQTIPFTSIVQGLGAKETSRLFLSCLMLANTYNVEISQSEEGEDVMDCMELTLLSRVRHHEELQEYAAPSQASPSKRKGRGKGSSKPLSNPEDIGMCVDQPLPICADITHLANGDLNAENIPSKKQAKVSKIKTKR
ncbi:condensin-2 complex subunit H2-like isoform X2 [Oratosquilla oratoria]|uniref:condensin-2 complex subunit H2-like isoform X2 n=1 Tax=Oratosquilla oratoria TaxID=337810 RepID=UPI003F76FDFA